MKKKEITLEEAYRMGQETGYMSAMRDVEEQLKLYHAEHLGFIAFFSGPNIKRLAKEASNNPFL